MNDDESLAVNNLTVQSYMIDVFKAANIESSNVRQKSIESVTDEKENPYSFCIMSPKVPIIDNIEVHAALLHVILKYELEVSRMPYYKWNENFSVTARKVIKVHSNSRLLEDLYVLFAKWAAYIETHQHHPVSLEIFHIILDSVICQCTNSKRNKAFKIKLPGQIKIYPAAIARVIKVGIVQKGIPESLNNSNINLKAKTDVVKFFWKSAYKLFDNFLSFVKNLHYDLDTSDLLANGQILKKIFIIIGKFENIEIPDDFPERNFKECVKESLMFGTKEHLLKNINFKILEDPILSIKKIDELIVILKFVLQHLSKFNVTYGLVLES